VVAVEHEHVEEIRDHVSVGRRGHEVGEGDPDEIDRRYAAEVRGARASPIPWRARSVRVREGKAIVTDGPFVATKEAVGGFDIIECASLEEAVEIAAGHPVAQTGTIEVRPLWGN